LTLAGPQRYPFGGAGHACPARVQTKLAISQPGDEYEQEADRVAEQVMRLPDPRPKDERSVLDAKSGPTIQRICAQCEEDEKLQRRTQNPELGTQNDSFAPPVVHDVLRSPGQPLDAATRAFMEPRFGHDFSRVRVHTDAGAAASARAVNAAAYTVGADVVFRPGRYAPHTAEGRRLLAHELVHVVQAGATPVAAPDPAAARVRARTTPSSLHRKQDPQQPAASEGTYTLTIGDTVLQNASKTDTIKALRRTYNRIDATVAGDIEGHKYMWNLRNDQYIVGFFADKLGGVSLPPMSIWEPVRQALGSTDAAIQRGSVEQTVDLLMDAQRLARDAHVRFIEYRDGTISGAERSVTVLKVTAAAGAVAATIATGGAAASAGAGLLGSSAAIGVVGGAYGATQEAAGQTGELIAETRKKFDLKPILQRGATDAVTNFVGAFVGGALTKYAAKMFGSYLSGLSEETLLDLGKELGFKGALPRDFFLTGGQKLIAEFLGGLGASPVATAVRIVTDRIVGKEELPDREKFVEMVIQEMIQGGALQIFLGTILHGRAPKVAGERSGAPPAGKSRLSSSLKSRLVGAAMRGTVEAAPITGGTGGGPGQPAIVETPGGRSQTRVSGGQPIPESRRFEMPEPGRSASEPAPVQTETGAAANPPQTAGESTPAATEGSQAPEPPARARESKRTAKKSRESVRQEHKRLQTKAESENLEYAADAGAELSSRKTGHEQAIEAQAQRGESNRLRRQARAKADTMAERAAAGELTHASMKTKAELIKEYDKTLRQAAGRKGWTVADSKAKGDFHEAISTTRESRNAGNVQKRYVKGNEAIPGMDQYIKGSAIPDGVEIHVENDQIVHEYYNLKSDNIHTMRAADARARATVYLDQAVRNNAAVPTKNSIVLRFGLRPSEEARGPLLNILLGPGSPIRAVHFESEVIRNPNLP
jgi:hypothetical protein